MNFNDFGSLASIIGLVISVITLVVVGFVKRKVQKLQLSNLFDQRINMHMTSIDTLQKELNLLMPNIVTNEIRVREILVQLLAEFDSLLPKLHDKKARKKTKKLICKIQRAKSKFFYVENNVDVSIFQRFSSAYRRHFHNMISSRMILNVYILVNENYNRIQQLKLDKNALIR